MKNITLTLTEEQVYALGMAVDWTLDGMASDQQATGGDEHTADIRVLDGLDAIFSERIRFLAANRKAECS